MSPQRMAYQAYNQAFHTVGKTRQVVMLYDGMIRFLRQAKEAMEENRIEDRFNLLTRTSEIALGLQSCLDFDNGDDVAKVLYDFYSSVDARILILHRTNDMELCQTLIDEIKEMRTTWEAIDRGEQEDDPAVEAEVSSPVETPVPPPPQSESLTTAPTPQPGALPLPGNITA